LATEILSLGKFKQSYETAVTDGHAVANTAIMGASEPTTTYFDLWAWYRNADASAKAEAKAWMDAKVPRGAAASVLRVTDFTTKYNTLIDTATAITDANVVAKVAVMRDVLAATRPTTTNRQPAWDAYQLLDASDKATVKEHVVLKPFIDGFTTLWATAWGNNAVTNLATAATLAGKTMQTATTPNSVQTGQHTQPFWAAMTKADERAALQKVMFTGAKAVGNKLT